MSTNETPESGAGKPALALIAGPTASGKSDCAVRLAQALEERGRRGVVVNADASQLYADLRVLSARPTEDEMRGVEHRLFGTWDGSKACSASDWAKAAKREIEAVHAKGSVPILVGGTGLYLRTLLDGIAPVPPIDPAIRKEVRALPVSAAYAALQAEDPERAATLNRADTARIARALEVVRSTGKPLGFWQERREGGIAGDVDLHPAVLLPEREALYARCDMRFARMFDEGAVEEVTALLVRELRRELPAMRAIGVREIAGWLRGDWTRAEAIAMGQQATRNYAKRQYTWFRRQPPSDWPRIGSRDFETDEHFARLLRN